MCNWSVIHGTKIFGGIAVFLSTLMTSYSKNGSSMCQAARANACKRLKRPTKKTFYYQYNNLKVMK